ncbi:MAG: stalk domain-containing protein [Desulfotomaculaceae bacterium]|nr:stalk domain-containing protein [Desulfotomaculaceae bacterium]
MLKSLPVVLGLSATLCFAGLAQAAPVSGNQWQNGFGTMQNGFQYQQSQPGSDGQWQNGQGSMQNNVQSKKSAPRVLVNGQNVNFDVEPTIENNRTLVPMRAILEALDLKVNWDEDTQTVTASNGDIEVELVIGGRAYVNGARVNLDVPAKIINGRTMVPVRFMSEAMGWNVGWDEDTQTVTIIDGEEVTIDDADDLSAPEALDATAVSSSQIKLTWDAVSDADYYYVYRSTTYSGSYSKIGTATAKSYKDTGLSSETTYYYVVKAVNSSGAGDASDVADATTESADDLSAPEDLEATTLSSSQIKLTWDEVSDADYYYVYRSTSSSGSYSKIGTATTESYKDTGLSSETKY